MNYPVKYSYLGFLFNGLVDSGAHEAIGDVKKNIENGTLFSWIKSKYAYFDISLYEKKELDEINEFFGNMANSVDESRKFSISNNGLCMLVAYCFEALQHKPD